MIEPTKKIIRRKFAGRVVSAKGNKTLVVEVRRTKPHPKYLKRYTFAKKYKVHDEKNEFRAGAEVVFVECRPLSRQKRWRVLGKKEKNS